MDKAAKRRWAFLAVALVATACAIVIDPERAAPDGRYAADPRPERVRENRKADPSAHTMPMPFEKDAIGDPFELRAWTVAPSNPSPQPVPSSTVQAAMPDSAAPANQDVPAAPPALPFKYVGSFGDDTGTSVYLSRGDQVLVVRKGEVIAASYRVVNIDATHVEFEHMPTATTQTLFIPKSE